jgi:hypothetical protein
MSNYPQCKLESCPEGEYIKEDACVSVNAEEKDNTNKCKTYNAERLEKDNK